MIDTLWHFIGQYGLIAIAIGCFIEGEIIILLGVLAVYQGILPLQGVWIAAMVGTLISDFFWFYLGHVMGRPALAKRPRWKERIARIETWFHRYGMIMVIGYHGLYAMRTLTPFVLGAIQVPYQKFIVYDIVGTLIWITGVIAISYPLAGAISSSIQHIQSVEQAVMATLTLAVVIGGGIYYWRRKKNQKKSADQDE